MPNQVEIAIFKEQLRSLSLDLGELKNNHFASLQKKVDEISGQVTQLEKRLAYYAGGLGVLVFLLDFVVKYLRWFVRPPRFGGNLYLSYFE